MNIYIMTRKQRILLLLAALCCQHFTCLDSFAQPDMPHATAVSTIDNTRLLQSWIKDREKLDLEFISNLNPDRLLHNFRITAGLPSTAEPLGGWESPTIGLRGHFVGHYLSALSVLAQHHNDSETARKLAYMIEELEKCQQAIGNGYLSAFPESEFDKLETTFTGVWAPYYTLHKLMQGLLDTWTATGNAKALDMVKRMAEYVNRRMSRLTDETINRLLDTRAANPSNEAGAMNEVLYRLYTVTGDAMHLKLARMFDPQWLAEPLSANKDILSGLHANTHLVLVNGFVWRYMLTGEERYLLAATNFWNMLHKNHTYINGSSSGPRPNATTRTSKTAEHWGEPGHLSNTLSTEIAESCVSHNTMKLSGLLFGLTASAIYAEDMMNMFYNAILPIQSKSTGKVVYHLPLGSPRTKNYLKADDFYCCSGTSMEAFAMLEKNIYWHNDTALWINQYVPSVTEWKEKGAIIGQSTNFPFDSEIEIKVGVRRKNRFAINLLLPTWTTDVALEVNGIAQMTKRTGHASYMTINRTWKDGDIIRLRLYSTFRADSLQGNSQLVAFSYGPMLLAFVNNEEIHLKSTKEELLRNIKVDNLPEGRFSLTDCDGREYQLRPLLDIDGEHYSVYVSVGG